jgi:Uma2 family endonuclease
MSAAPRFPPELGYAGMRMNAAEYLSLGETRERYELIHGTVVMSPSPTPKHQRVLLDALMQLEEFARSASGIHVFPDTDVLFAPSVVYRPDIAAFVRPAWVQTPERLTEPPDLVVEVLSGGTQFLDQVTKRDDYDRFAVGEYWIVDPNTGHVRAWRRQGTRLIEVPTEGDTLPCASIPGFALDLASVRATAGR